MRLTLGTRYYKERELPASTINLINLFAESKSPDSKGGVILKKVPGYSTYLIVGSGPIRGAHVMDNILYVVSGTELYSISEGTSTLQGTIAGTGLVGIASNDRESGPQLVIVNGTTTQYVYTSAGGLTTATLTGPAYTVTYQDGYFIYDWSGTGKWFISNVNDGTTYDSLETGATNTRPDDVVAVISNHQQIWVFGTNTIEIFYNSGNLDFPFLKISEATNDELGLGARRSLVELDNTIFWVGSDREVYRAVGYNAQIISDPTVSEVLKSVDLDQVTAFSYSRGGHKFYNLNLPDISLVFDVKENIWHQRGWFDNGEYHRNRADVYVDFGAHIVGDYQNGYLYEMSDEYQYDALGADLRWEMVMPPLHNDGRPFSLRRIELDIIPGVGLTTGQGSDPQVFFSVSEDGQIWGSERWIGIGAKGKYKNKALVHRLGTTDDQFIYKFAGSDPVETTIVNCYAI